MGLRPASCYKDTDKPAFTRIAITVPDRNYIGTSPGNKIRQFNMGNPTKNFSHVVDLLSENKVQLRDNAIESMRTNVNRYLFKRTGKESYFMKIRVYPHQILRENKQATGAGADRIQKGMSHPYGRPIGRAVRLHKGQVILSVLTDEEFIPVVKAGLLKASTKLGTPVSCRVGRDVESIGTKPKKVRDTEEKKAEETAAATGDAKTETGKTATAAPAAGKKEEPKKAPEKKK